MVLCSTDLSMRVVRAWWYVKETKSSFGWPPDVVRLFMADLYLSLQPGLYVCWWEAKLFRFSIRQPLKLT